MIVYGDRRASEDPRALARALLADCGVADRAPRWTADEARRRVLVGAGELAQALVDHAFTARGELDELGPMERVAARLTLAAARTLLGQGLAADVAAVVHELLRAPLPERVTVRVPEGYAFYALVPDAYADAARRAGGPLLAIGLRSIGTGLAAVVAAASGGRLPPVTLRPVGHPFARTVKIGPALERWLLDTPADARFAVVDEGPGLSGSSLNAVADWLEARGIAADRIVFLPHHGGELGPEASPTHRERWERAARFPAAVEPRRLVREDAVQDLSGGRWRARVHGRDVSAWPPVDARQERLKLLVEPARGAPRLYKFAGLGRYGDSALARARALEAAGLGPPVLGLEHGFLVMRWLADALPADVVLACGGDEERRGVVAGVTGYVAAVARGLPRAPRASGASPGALLDMAVHNAGAALGAAAAHGLERWREALPRLAASLQPVATDCRMHAWEWLVLPDGHVVKTDGVDHHAAHDLIGCQDVAWDVAGAVIELDLDPDERGRVARAARRRDELVLRFHEDCYLAFQLGRCWVAARGAAPDEAARLEAAQRRYAARLTRSLGAAAAS